jgi:hypothetical protein
MFNDTLNNPIGIDVFLVAIKRKVLMFLADVARVFITLLSLTNKTID